MGQRLDYLNSLLQKSPADPNAVRGALISLYNYFDQDLHCPSAPLLLLTQLVAEMYGDTQDWPQQAKDTLALARTIGQYIETGGDGTDKNAYHNRLHFAKVTCNAYVIGRMMQTTLQECLENTCRALAHDLGHDGIGNSGTPFRLEQRAITTARHIARMRHYDPDMLNWDLILATDVSGHPSPASLVRKAYLRQMTPQERVYYPELAALCADQAQLQQAVILMDADILASLISSAQHKVEGVYVAREAGYRSGPRESLHFIQKIADGGCVTPVAQAISFQGVQDIVANAYHHLHLMDAQRPL